MAACVVTSNAVAPRAIINNKAPNTITPGQRQIRRLSAFVFMTFPYGRARIEPQGEWLDRVVGVALCRWYGHRCLEETNLREMKATAVAPLRWFGPRGKLRTIESTHLLYCHPRAHTTVCPNGSGNQYAVQACLQIAALVCSPHFAVHISAADNRSCRFF